MRKLQFIILLLLQVFVVQQSQAESGYDLWLRYPQVENQKMLDEYRKAVQQVVVAGDSKTAQAIQNELAVGLKGLLGVTGSLQSQTLNKSGILVGTPTSSSAIAALNLGAKLEALGNDGYIIQNKKIGKANALVVASKTDVGALYGTFHLLRLMQTNQSLANLNIEEKPLTQYRLLNHWDNLDRTVERGYSGFSIWDWHKLPDVIDQRYIDYARANASVGINGTVLTNVNANALILTPQYLKKVAALADVFRTYGIKVYVTARFSAPVEIGKLKNADPSNPEVQTWWNEKVDEIYTLIPDFGGFLVKANSEGQPGPQNYGRDHADGANMLAKALGKHPGIVMWRAFVYDSEVPQDRHKQAANEFVPLDGRFEKNVFVQVKNGAIDFQPREPFHPLFGTMPKTPIMMEFQITQEYLGLATNLVYLAPLFKETLDADTHVKGAGSTVAKVIDGTLENHSISGMAGVANIGNDINWTGHPFGQANWYAFGRLAWNHELTSEGMAEEWIRMTFNNNASFINLAKSIMMESRETAVSYMTPLGLHHIMARNHHWGPGPWVTGGRPDWTSLYYHRADSIGIGFNRTTTGSNAVSQYAKPVADMFNNIETCPEDVLLWFHHVPWDYKLKSGKTLWNEIVDHYYRGTEDVRRWQKEWEQAKPMIDAQRYEQVRQLLAVQANEAKWWRDACLLYFQQFSKRPIPANYEQPEHDLEYYQNLKFRFVPGIEN